VPSETENSLPRRGSSASLMRSETPLPKAASDRQTIAPAGIGPSVVP
jgi:hypothetical protein